MPVKQKSCILSYILGPYWYSRTAAFWPTLILTSHFSLLSSLVVAPPKRCEPWPDQKEATRRKRATRVKVAWNKYIAAFAAAYDNSKVTVCVHASQTFRFVYVHFIYLRTQRDELWMGPRAGDARTLLLLLCASYLYVSFILVILYLSSYLFILLLYSIYLFYLFDTFCSLGCGLGFRVLGI
jgi:hypothetical protein